MAKRKLKYKSEHGSVTVTNGSGRARLKRKKTGRVAKKVKQSKG